MSVKCAVPDPVRLEACGGRGGRRKSCVIRSFVKLPGQPVAPRGPRASCLPQWAPREQFSPLLARAIITDVIKMKSETGHVGSNELKTMLSGMMKDAFTGALETANANMTAELEFIDLSYT